MNSPEMSDQDYLKQQIRRRALLNRIFMGFSIFSTGVLVCCCVPLMLIQYAFAPTETTKPAEVDAVARRIAPRLVVPPGFTGSLARSADNSIVRSQIARFDQDAGRGRLLLGFAHWHALSGIDAQQLQTVFDELYPGQRLLDARKTRKKILMFRGQTLTIEIVDGEDRGSSIQYKQVTGRFAGPDGAVQLLLQVESNFITDDSIDMLLQSLADEPDEVPDTK